MNFHDSPGRAGHVGTFPCNLALDTGRVEGWVNIQEGVLECGHEMAGFIGGDSFFLFHG